VSSALGNYVSVHTSRAQLPHAVPCQPPLYRSPTSPSGGGRDLASAPVNDTASTGGGILSGGSRPPGAVSANAFNVDVTVTNTSTVAWKGGDLRLWYRWYTPEGVVLFEGPGTDFFPQTVQPEASKKIAVTVEPPPALPGTELAQVRLRFDIYDTSATAANKWFGGQGNPWTIRLS
jgi:hypothetical protein